MKRILALIVAAALCALFAACGQSSEPSSSDTVTQAVTEAPSVQATQSPTEAPTEVPTELPTEAPTERPRTVIVQSSEKTAELDGDGYFTYTNSKYGWSAEIPEIWNQYGYIVEDDETGSVTFMDEASRFSGMHLSGEVMVLMTAPVDTELRGNWGDTEVARNDEFKVYWDKPSDVQYPAEYADEYHALCDTRESILRSVGW